MHKTKRGPTGLSVTILVIVAALFGTALPAGAASTKYVHREHGFLIKLISPKWSETPTQPGEKVEVAKFKDEKRQQYATLSIYRFAVTSGEVTTPSQPSPQRPNPRNPYARPTRAKPYLEAVVQRAMMHYGIEFGGLPDPKTTKFGKVEGDLYRIEIESEHPRMRGYTSSFIVGIVSSETEEYLILYNYPQKLKKLQKACERSVRSFRFPDDDTPEETASEARGKRTCDEDELLDLEKRNRIKADLPDHWRYIDTPNYVIIYNCNRELADHIAKRVEYLRERAFETVFPPAKPIEECMVIRICKEMAEYHHYGGPPGSAGYWASGKDELVFPDLSRSKRPDEQTVGVMAHEAFHQYVFYALLKHNPPVWFNEGFAEYFFCVNSRGKKLTFEKQHSMRYGVVKSALGTGTLYPADQFIRLTHRQYMMKASLCYSQGWAFSTWLKNVTKNERYQQIPDIYFRELQQGYLEQTGQRQLWVPGGGLNAVEKNALEKAFEGIDMEELDAAFKKDLKRRM